MPQDLQVSKETEVWMDFLDSLVCLDRREKLDILVVKD